MGYDPKIHHRRSIRLKHFDYSSRGAYFLTICVHNRSCLFGEVCDGKVHLNERGKMIDETWRGLPRYLPGLTIDQSVVMPNHLHGIVWVGARPEGSEGRTQRSAPTEDDSPPTSAPTFPQVVQRFKTFTTNEYAKRVRTSHWPAFSGRLWQTNYFEHIIRDDPSLESIRYYIENNPARWASDAENPDGDGTDNLERFIGSLGRAGSDVRNVPPDFNLLLNPNS
jgi:REP element-mobilizing transposase RayT